MNWINNLITYTDSGQVGKCPECNSDSVKVVETKHGLRKSITFICEKCGSSNHFDGVE